jgi:hypothetical protein
MTRNIFSLLRFLENQSINKMEKTTEKVWLQQPKEKDIAYRLFVSFCNFNGTLEDFIKLELGNGNCDYTPNYLRKIASPKMNKWLQRKEDYLAHQSKINSSSNLRNLQAIEDTSWKAIDAKLKFINDKIQQGKSIFQQGKEIEGLNKLVSLTEKINRIKQNPDLLGSEDLNGIASSIDDILHIQDNE